MKSVTDTTNLLMAIAREAGDAIAAMSRDQLGARYKAPHELVTAADERSHAIIAQRLHHAFPGMPLLLEEQVNERVPEQPYLLGDELDGTAMFAAGTADWGVTLARMDGAPTHGVIYLPARGLMISARRGGGCQINGLPVKLDSGRRLREAVWATELNPRIGARPLSHTAALVAATLTTRCLACSTASIAELLLGQTHLYVNAGGGKLWDFAAGVLAVEEAGGVALRVDGSPIRWDELRLDVLLASDKPLADEALRLLPD